MVYERRLQKLKLFIPKRKNKNQRRNKIAYHGKQCHLEEKTESSIDVSRVEQMDRFAHHGNHIAASSYRTRCFTK